jgi:hypothetical protein
MGSVVADLRYAARELRRRPGFAVTAVLSLALGIGATSAVFSVVYGVLINPFPYVGADRMMQLALRDNAGQFRYPGMTGAQLEQLRQSRTVESVVGEDGWNLTTTDGDIPEDVVASYITPNAPNHWGVPALMEHGSSLPTRLPVWIPSASSCSATNSGSGITRVTRRWSGAPSNSSARTIKSSA